MCPEQSPHPGWPRALVRRLWLGWPALAAFALAGCDNGADTGLTCGAGTVAHDGECVLASTPVACGAGTILEAGQCRPDPDAPALPPAVAKVELEQLRLQQTGRPHVLHMMRVSASVEVVGEAFGTDLIIGIQSDDGAVGCTIGALPICHRPGPEAGALETARSYELSEELQIPEACGLLVGQPDLRLMASFDPWRRVDLAGRLPIDELAAPQGDQFFHFVAHSGADLVAACVAASREGCVVPIELRGNPGRDVELLELTLDSSVVVLPYPVLEHPGATAEEVAAATADAGMPVDPEATFEPQDPVRVGLPTAPHVLATGRFRVLGLSEEARLDAGNVSVAFEIRPLLHHADEESIAPELREWSVIHSEEHQLGEDGLERRLEEDRPIANVRGALPHVVASTLTFSDDTLDRLLAGPWAGIEEFEVRGCVNAAFEEAVYPEEDEARPNHCATLHIVLVRKSHGPFGEVAPSSLEAGATTIRRDKVYEGTWSAQDAGLSAKAWKDMGATGVAGTPFGQNGDSMIAAGNFFEAGARSVVTLFGRQATLAEAFVQFRDFTGDSGQSDKVKMRARILIFDLFPYFDVVVPDGELTLKNILDIPRALQGGDYPVDKTFEMDLVGKSFSVPCGGGTAAIKAFVQLGLDEGATKLVKRSAPGTAATCTNGEPRSSDGRHCFVRPSTNYVTLPSAEKICSDLGGTLPTLTDARDDATVLAAFNSSYWLNNTLTYQPTFTGAVSATMQKTFYRPTVGAAWSVPDPDGAIARLLATPDPADGNTNATSQWKLLMGTSTSQVYRWSESVASGSAVCEIPVRSAGPEGSTLEVEIVPHIAGGASATVGVDFSFIGIELALNIRLVDFLVHFVGTATLNLDTLGNVALDLSRRVFAEIVGLSGELELTISWETGWWIFKKSGKHTKPIIEWSGFTLGTFDIVPEETIRLQ